jgi:hypothetical protein
VIVAVASLSLTACSSDEGQPAAGGSPTSSTSVSPGGTPSDIPIAVTLREYAVLPAVAAAPAGKITFNVKNIGPTMEHEFVVVKTSLSPDKLPTNADGSVEEEGPGFEAIGELSEFPVGQTKTTTLTMVPGTYVLFCNVVHTEASETHVHYKLGMRTAFTVT